MRATNDGGGGGRGRAACASSSRSNRRHSTSSNFLPFSSSAGSVDDTPAGGRASRMCRPQRIRPSCCCVEFIHSSHRVRRSNCYRHHQTVDHCHCYHYHFTCCRRRSGAPNSRPATNMPSQGTEVPLPAPPTDADEQRPKRRTLWQALRKNCHWKCFVLTLMIDGCLAIILWCQWTQKGFLTVGSPLGASYDTRKGACEQGYNFIPVAFAVMLYVVYIMECWHCRTRLDLLCKTDIRSLYEYIAQLRETLPMVWWRAVCYHYVRRTRQVTRYRNGDAITSTQVYYERINSHTACSTFSYQDCGVKDISKKLLELERFAVTRLRFRKGFVFANLQAANEFEEQRARFFQENEQRDDYMEVREGLDLINVSFKENMVVFADPSHRPWFLAQPTFWLCSLLLLSWPLRVLIEYCTAYVNYQVTKLFGTNYLSPSSQNYTGPLTRVSTMDSGELESVIRNNYVVVPSYSEALLMDPVQSRTAVATGNGIVHIQTKPSAVGPSLDGSRFALPNHRRLGCGSTNGEAMLTNERVYANYGALINEDRRRIANVISRSPFGRGRAVHPDGGSVLRTDTSPLQQFIASAQRRSRSLSILLFRTRSSSDSIRNTAGTPHSISIGSLAALAKGSIRRPYRTLPTTPDASSASATQLAHLFHEQDQIEEAPEEPPPSYDLALKLCHPAAEFIKGHTPGDGSSTSAVSDRFRWIGNLGAPGSDTSALSGRNEETDSERTTSAHVDARGYDTML